MQLAVSLNGFTFESVADRLGSWGTKQSLVVLGHGRYGVGHEWNVQAWKSMPFLYQVSGPSRSQYWRQTIPRLFVGSFLPRSPGS